MHYPCMIVGPDPEAQLEPFSDVQVDRYKEFLDAEDVSAMAEHFGVPDSDLTALASRMPEWHQEEGGVEGGRLYFWTTSNPKTKFDWYVLGGRFDGFLRLRDARTPSAWRRLFGAKASDRANSARKRDIRVDDLVADPPSALLMEGQWLECPVTSEPGLVEAWKQEFAAAFARVPEDALLTVMDLHS